ncbi:MAG TPA: hypothetical protein VE953_23845 [Terriglobales bacterium]|nr:hypothetical protein [Terriglobales bacterium]
MIDELVETILPGGVWLTAGVVVGAAFGTALRPAAVRVMAVGMAAADRLQEVGAETYEKVQDLVAEARHERQQQRAAEAPPPAAPRRRAVRVESE